MPYAWLVAAHALSHLLLEYVGGDPVPLLAPFVREGIGLESEYPVRTLFGRGPLGLPWFEVRSCRCWSLPPSRASTLTCPSTGPRVPGEQSRAPGPDAPGRPTGGARERRGRGRTGRVRERRFDRRRRGVQGRPRSGRRVLALPAPGPRGRDQAGRPGRRRGGCQERRRLTEVERLLRDGLGVRDQAHPRGPRTGRGGPREEYEAVRDGIIEILSTLRTPAGEPAFEFVERREAVYEGPLAGEAPDVLFMPTDSNHDVWTEIVGRTFVPIDAYNHRREGVFLGTGPRLGGDSSGSTSRTDVAPLAMALRRFDVPERMTGSVPAGMVDGRVSVRSYSGVEFGGWDASEEPDEVRQRLDDLGYI